MGEDQITVVKINQDYCSRCLICYALCPYEAIEKDAETDKVEIDIQKCQVCGLCYSACPVFAIEIAYYTYDDLVKYVREKMQQTKADTLVCMCRGNSPSTGEIDEILENQGLKVENYIPLRLPCSGRMPAEFIFNVLGLGIKKIVSIQCEDEFCRYKEGTKANTRRLLLSKKVLEDLGYPSDALTVVKYSRKAIYFTEKCVGCDKCVFICPYSAIEAEDLATPKVLDEYCMGCGACALVCPHHAIQLKGFEFEEVLKRYMDAAAKYKARGKSPLILAFCCQWSEFKALDEPEKLISKNILPMEIPCFNALDPVHIVNALQNGFDGVIGIVCSDDDCKLQEGRHTSRLNMEVLNLFLDRLGLSGRFELFEASPRFISNVEKKLDEFIEKIASMKTAKTLQVKKEV
ncbi:hydrogenase iron-sulfur subunit [Candidatus Bathyarchaeota archaeon]|nr:hydrogenase iron-sulfur subunit [Candidatus Bathyarchaeota archaeon]